MSCGRVLLTNGDDGFSGRLAKMAAACAALDAALVRLDGTAGGPLLREGD